MGYIKVEVLSMRLIFNYIDESETTPEIGLGIVYSSKKKRVRIYLIFFAIEYIWRRLQ